MPVPPYERIAAEIRRRITAGELRPGDRLPSTRQIVADFGVAMATATKALTALQLQGLARPVPGVGTVVAAPGGAASATPAAATLDRSRIVASAIEIADIQGLAALSMRRVAASLGVTTMALYRHVPGKDRMTLLMADAVFRQTALPDPPPAQWRARLEAAARTQWAMYRRHPWLAQTISFTRPLLSPAAMAHSEWMMRALDGLGLDPVVQIHVVAGLAAHARGLAVDLETEADAAEATGLTDEQWMDSFATPAIQTFALMARVPPHSLDLDTMFEFGLDRLLDGIAALTDTSRQPGHLIRRLTSRTR